MAAGLAIENESQPPSDPDEISRKMSINSAVLPCEWKNTKINLIDTPGYPDFVGEAVGSLRAEVLSCSTGPFDFDAIGEGGSSQSEVKAEITLRRKGRA